jgi:hypothetical protein
LISRLGLNVNDVNLLDRNTTDKRQDISANYFVTKYFTAFKVSERPFDGFLSNSLSFQYDAFKDRTTGQEEAGQKLRIKDGEESDRGGSWNISSSSS